METSDADVVLGVQDNRSGDIFRRWSGSAFYKLFNLFSDTHVAENQMTARLMRRAYVDALLQVRDRNLFLAGTMTWTGFHQCAIRLNRKQRVTPSSYTLARRFGLSFTAITSFSSYPLRLVFVTGAIISLLAGIAGLYMLIHKLLDPQAVLLGYASLFVSIWFFSGLIILFLGLIGIYLSGIFIEVKERPPYIIRRVYDHTRSRDGQPEGVHA